MNFCEWCGAVPGPVMEVYGAYFCEECLNREARGREANERRARAFREVVPARVVVATNSHRCGSGYCTGCEHCCYGQA
jgi:hypothetical protein